MPSEGFVLGLNGEEIIYDVLDQVEKALRKDCNLRQTDSYGQGYDGKITISLNLRALDVAKVEIVAQIKPSAETLALAAPVGKDPAINEAGDTADGLPAEPPVVTEREVSIEENIEIPLETDLNEIRERSGQGVPMASVGQDGKTEIRRRSYKAVSGGALGGTEAESL